MLYNKVHLARRKALGVRGVARSGQLVEQLRAAVNPSHQVVHGRARQAVGEVVQGQFLLGIGPEDKLCLHG